MPEDQSPKELVSRSEIAALADLFDRSELAIDPTSRGAKMAESDFEDQVRRLYEGKIKMAEPDLPFVVFRARLRTLCRKYLFKN